MIQTGLLFLILVFIAWNLLFCDGLRRPHYFRVKHEAAARGSGDT
jgi:hypothetical protein